MLKSFFAWWHHLLNPHCQFCIDEAQDKLVCQSCEILKNQLNISNIEKERLLRKLLDTPVEVTSVRDEELKPILPKMVPWNVRKQMLESEDREKAKLMRKAQKDSPNQSSSPNPSIEELEKELGVDESNAAS